MVIVLRFMNTDCCTDPCDTARLSNDIRQGVVGPDLTAHGANKLRVIDASVIPIIPDCRIQNAVHMIGEKVAPRSKIRMVEADCFHRGLISSSRLIGRYTIRTGRASTSDQRLDIALNEWSFSEFLFGW